MSFGREIRTTPCADFYLIFVEFAVFVGRLSLVLEGDDDETDEDVNHEEGNDNDVDEIKHCHNWTEVLNWPNVLGV